MNYQAKNTAQTTSRASSAVTMLLGTGAAFVSMTGLAIAMAPTIARMM